MTLDELATVADILAGFGIIISLLLVAWQIRQNTRATNLDVSTGITERIDNIRAQVLVDPELASILTRADEDFSSLTHEERLKFSIQMTSYFNMADITMEVGGAGYTTSHADLRASKFFKGLISSPARLAWWERHAQDYSPALQERIAELQSS